MREGGVIEFSRLPDDLSSLLTCPKPTVASDTEYNQLRILCSEVLDEISSESIVYIQSSDQPIYRSSDPISEHSLNPKQLNDPEFMTQNVHVSDGVKVSKHLNANVFILINYSCFNQEWTLDKCKNLMGLWEEKVQNGLDEFAGKVNSPKIKVMVYDDINQIDSNPMEHYVEVLMERPAANILEKKLPTVFIDCSPISNHSSYQFHYQDKVPEFTLCFSLIDEKHGNLDANVLNQISDKIRSGFTIFQKVDFSNSMKSVAEVLKISAVLCAKMVIGNKDESMSIFHDMSFGAFLESRKIKVSKACSSKLNRTYNSSSSKKQEGIPDITKGWIDYKGDQVKSALNDYYRSLLHCKYKSDDRELRNMIELRVGAWAELLYNITIFADRLKELKFGGNPSIRKRFRAAKHRENIDLILRIIDDKKEEMNSLDEGIKDNALKFWRRLKSYIKTRLEVDADLDINDFRIFFEEFSSLTFELNDIYYVASSLFHTNLNEKNQISDLNNHKIYFYLSTRLKLYKPLSDYLISCKTALEKYKSQRPNVAIALNAALRLDLE